MIYTKTSAGQQAFKERSPLFTPRQRTAFIMFDGSKSLADILDATVGLGLTDADVEMMVANGFLVLASGAVL
jgi:hypothetical protein